MAFAFEFWVFFSGDVVHVEFVEVFVGVLVLFGGE